MRSAFRAVVAAFMMSGFASAQADVSTATLTGRVGDQSGGALAAATVVVTSIERGTSHTTTANSVGRYVVPLLEPGSYELRVAAPGFATHVVRSLVLGVGDVRVLDAQLALAPVTTETIVTAPESRLDPRRTQQADTVSTRQVASLPNVRRDFTPYVLVLPGVSDPEAPRAQFPGMAWPTSGFAVGGSNGHANLLTIDGGEHEYGSGVFRTPLNVETIQEFQVNRNGFAAEFGFTSGTAVNIVTKSGTNRPQGSLYGYFRSDDLAAKNFFDPATSSAFFQTVTAGGTAGGPLVRNRLFGFAAYEGWKADRTRARPYLDNLEVYGPTANPAASIGLRSQQAYLAGLDASPDPNIRRIGGTLRQTLTTTNFPTTMQLLRDNAGDISARDRRHYVMGRVDYESGSRDSLMGRVTVFRSTTDSTFTADNPTSAPSNGFIITSPDYAALGSWARVVSDTAVNQTRAQVASNDSVLDPVSPRSTSLNISGVATFGRQWGMPFSLRQNRYQFENTFTVYRGRHTMKAGASYRPIDYAVRDELWFGGDWTFASGIYPVLLAVSPQDQPALAVFNATTTDPSTGRPYPAAGPPGAALTGLQSFNLGLPFLYRQGFNNPEWTGWAHYLGLFAQDSWQLSPRVSLDFGIRYDIDREPAPLRRHAYTSPRGGVAWDLGGNQRTVLRAAGGMFYAPIGVQIPYFGALLDDSGRYINQIFKTPADGPQSPAVLWAIGRASGKLPNGALAESDLRSLGIQTGRGAPGRVIFEVDPAYENPYTIQGSVGASHQLGGSISIDVAYLTYHGRQLGLSYEANYRETGVIDPLLGPMYAPIDPTIIQRNVARSIGSSEYHGLTLSLNKAYSDSYQFQANYTLSRTEDDVTDTDASLSAFMPTRLDREWGRSVFDVRHNFVFHAVVQVPTGGETSWRRPFGGVTIAPVVRARSGGPFTLRIGRDVNGDTHPNDRPFQADRNTGRGPGYFAIDLRVSKSVPLGERATAVELIVEATNLTNRTNFTAVNDVVGTDPQFLRGPFDLKGRADVSQFSTLGFTAAAPARQVQIGMRLRF